MRWGLENANAHRLVQAYEHYGQKVPTKLIPPELHDIEFDYWRAFQQLSTERQMGQYSSGPIPWSAIQKYSEVNGIADQEMFMLIIREMDDCYMSVQLEQARKAAQNKR